MCSMKKCKGCGAPIQNKDPKMTGYSVNLEQDYCQRCFRLTHYGDLGLLKLKEVHNDEVYEIYRENRDALFVLIVEAFDALILNIDDLLSHFKDFKVLLIINKIDLLPSNITENKIEVYDKTLSEHGHMICEKCGKTADINLNNFKKVLSKELKCDVTAYKLTISYICPSCKEKVGI